MMLPTQTRSRPRCAATRAGAAGSGKGMPARRRAHGWRASAEVLGGIRERLWGAWLFVSAQAPTSHERQADGGRSVKLGRITNSRRRDGGSEGGGDASRAEGRTDVHMLRRGGGRALLGIVEIGGRAIGQGYGGTWRWRRWSQCRRIMRRSKFVTDRVGSRGQLAAGSLAA